MKLPWSIRFFLQWWPKMSIDSILRYRKHELGQSTDGYLALEMKEPIRGTVTLRTHGSDFATFEEIVSQEIYKEVLQYVPTCKTIIDLGANIGLATLYFAFHFPDAHILSVEPHKETFTFLQKNLAQTPNAQPVNAAVWGSSQMLSLSSDTPDHFSAMSISNREGDVQGVTISQVLAMCDSDTIDILKVDIEGAEVELFKGDTDWLNRVKCIAIEFHGDSRRESKFDDLMSRYGFQVHEGTHTVIAVTEAARAD